MPAFVIIDLGRELSGLCSCSDDGWSWLLTEYGPAVAGRATISTRFFIGRTGATDMPPDPIAMVDSGRVRTCGTVVPVEDEDAVDEFDTVRAGEKEDMADPGRGGSVFAANAAFF